mmetsp:Transcript_21260/g.53536  ORF Transcript_21260/g.53536 Transcript_21260/m.53536 type:complete len:202 (+) Transcript_21260:1497-2102(+)
MCGSDAPTPTPSATPTRCAAGPRPRAPAAARACSRRTSWQRSTCPTRTWTTPSATKTLTSRRPSTGPRQATPAPPSRTSPSAPTVASAETPTSPPASSAPSTAQRRGPLATTCPEALSTIRWWRARSRAAWASRAKSPSSRATSAWTGPGPRRPTPRRAPRRSSRQVIVTRHFQGLQICRIRAATWCRSTGPRGGTSRGAT